MNMGALAKIFMILINVFENVENILGIEIKNFRKQ
jgi:hypothetical protein